MAARNILRCIPQVYIVRTVFFVKGILNISDTKMAAEENSRLYRNVFVFRIYNISQGK
jgi:hypothetical protein